jgi:hypothetical protein
MRTTGKGMLPSAKDNEHEVRFVRDGQGRFFATFLMSKNCAPMRETNRVVSVDPGARIFSTFYAVATGLFSAVGLVEDADRVLNKQHAADKIQVRRQRGWLWVRGFPGNFFFFRRASCARWSSSRAKRLGSFAVNFVRGGACCSSASATRFATCTTRYGSLPCAVCRVPCLAN